MIQQVSTRKFNACVTRYHSISIMASGGSYIHNNTVFLPLLLLPGGMLRPIELSAVSTPSSSTYLSRPASWMLAPRRLLYLFGSSTTIVSPLAQTETVALARQAEIIGMYSRTTTQSRRRQMLQQQLSHRSFSIQHDSLLFSVMILLGKCFRKHLYWIFPTELKYCLIMQHLILWNCSECCYLQLVVHHFVLRSVHTI